MRMQDGHGMTLESYVPGRVRVRLAKEHRHTSLMSDLAALVEDVTGLRKVTTNPKTGGILIEYDPDTLDIGQLVTVARMAGLMEDVDIPVTTRVTHKSLPPWPSVSPTAEKILGEIRRVDNQVYRATNGVWDAKTLIPAGLLGLALYRAIVSGRNSPVPWYTLVWYAYSTFMHWHNPRKGPIGPAR
jgi:hypothetical protein